MKEKTISTKIIGRMDKDLLEIQMPSALAEKSAFFDWPEECYAGNWMIDCDGQYQFLVDHYEIPRVPKSWERIYN